jgi:hypothetical protein
MVKKALVGIFHNLTKKQTDALHSISSYIGFLGDQLQD